jgi:hypothetical protein
VTPLREVVERAAAIVSKVIETASLPFRLNEISCFLTPGRSACSFGRLIGWEL